jgi:hypothetical protein
MRTLMQIVIPVESGNEAARKGTLATTIQKILEPMKPEAVYFTTGATGERGGFIVFDLKDASHLPAVAEPFFLAFNARLTFSPVMNAADLASAAPAIEKAAKDHGRGASA